MHKAVHAPFVVTIIRELPLKAATFVKAVLTILKIPIVLIQTPPNRALKFKSVKAVFYSFCVFSCFWPADAFRRQFAF